MIYIVIILTFLLVFVLISLLLFTLFYKEKAIDKLKYFDENYVVLEKADNNKKQNIKPLKTLAKLFPNFRRNNKQVKKEETLLIKADIPITVEELMVIKMLSSTAFSFLAYSLTKNFIITFIVFILIWNLPKIIINNRRKNRIKLFDNQLKEGIMIISNSLKAGYSFLQAVAVVGEETEEPFSKEFKKLLKEMSLGISEEDALKNLITRMESEDLRLIVNAILIQKDIGGNLSEILDNIAETVRERQKIKEELKTLMAQGKLSGIIVMLIPLFLGIVIFLFNKAYMLVLFTTPIGLSMIGISIFNEVLGLIMIQKIINIDV